MSTIHLYYTIHHPMLNNEWNKMITLSLKRLKGIEQVYILEKNETPEARINLNYDIEIANADQVQDSIAQSGAVIRSLNLDFPAQISRIPDAITASAASPKIKEKLMGVNGVLDVSISSNGTVRVDLDPGIPDKKERIDTIVKSFG